MQTRSFCYVSDLIDGIAKLAPSDEHSPVNIGKLVEFRMLECAKLVLEVTGARVEIVFKALPQDDPTRRRPDITKAQSLFSWFPGITLREGLQKSLAYFQGCASLPESLQPLGKSSGNLFAKSDQARVANQSCCSRS